MNGWEILYEALRQYISQPESVVCERFINYLSHVQLVQS